MMADEEHRHSTPTHNPRAAVTASSRKSSIRRRFAAEDGASRDPMVECSGKRCKSCTAGVVADCVAICCCPCALLNLLALAFVRVPYMVCRRCLQGGTAKQQKRRAKAKAKTKESGERKRGNRVIVEDEEGRGSESAYGVVGPGGLEEEVVGLGMGEGLEGEDEKGWLDLELELYKIGHLSFGRVSFNGIQFQGKGS